LCDDSSWRGRAGLAAENLMERQSDKRKILWAVLISLAVHLAVAFSLAAFGGDRNAPAETEEKPIQLTFMDLPVAPPPPAPPKNPPFIAVDPSRKSATAPKEKTFESNENSIAAAEKAASGSENLPSQSGKDRPAMQLESHESSLAANGAAPVPTPEPSKIEPKERPTPTPAPSETPGAQETPPPDQLALLTHTPPPALAENPFANPTPELSTPTPTVQPTRAASRYRDYQEQTVIHGSISNRGRSAVNAVGTPLGRYKKQIEDALGSRWYFYIAKQRDMVTVGTTRVTLEIEPDGRVTHIKITENNASEVSANIALRAIEEAKFPPIPDDLLPTLPDGHYTMETSFTIFPN
jgi:outer membrane biosynthesis protein TonB